MIHEIRELFTYEKSQYNLLFDYGMGGFFTL